MKKKLLSLMLAGSMLAAATSCSSSKSSTPPQPTTTEQGKTIVNIAYIDSNYESVGYLKKSLPSFNLNKKYQAEIDYYTFDIETESQTTACNRLSNDILSGKVPDLIAASPAVIQRLYKNGYVADLSEIMEEYGGIQKNDLLDNVAESITMDDGTIPGIFSRFELITSIVNANFTDIDSSSWTLDRAIKEYNSAENKMLFTYLMQPLSDDMDYFLKGAIMSCFDYKSNEFHPNNGMADALDFIADMNSYAEDYQFDYWYHLDNLITGKSLLNNVRLSGINSKYKQEAIMRFDGAPVSLIGYPTTDGGKPYAIIPSMYAIPTNAANKEGAWAFICCLLSMDEQKSNNLERNGGFPVIKSAVQPLLNESSVNLNSINNDSSGSYIMRADEDPNYEKPLMTDEKKQQLADYISNAELLPYKSEEAEEIICEEFQAVINGKLSSDKCIELLRDRLATFLAERK